MSKPHDPLRIPLRSPEPQSSHFARICGEMRKVKVNNGGEHPISVYVVFLPNTKVVRRVLTHPEMADRAV
ncbi:hypothetical protein HYALB_00004793 [Hymenoscyphus albidus]|uniref:Uncharacterized protein n=1 Tax=Hymenoscyphus albidus TaxID=595503 RepID=A0A9N9LLZ7_9HELO|nr:hypothetical protein HYALB_00004793 [Hymenoscyphus albidus]